MTQQRPHKPRGDYDIGYGKPPVHSQFRKGTSGNPKGRPKSVKSDQEIISAILAEKCVVRGPSGPRRIVLRSAMWRKHIELAAKGDARSLHAVMKYVGADPLRAGIGDPAAIEDLNAEDLALLADLQARLKGGSNEGDSGEGASS